MRKLALFVLMALIAGTLVGCVVRTRGRPCRTDCWWDHGRRVCQNRCR